MTRSSLTEEQRRERDQQIFELYYYAGLDYWQIAIQFRLCKGHVENIVRVGLERWREEYAFFETSD